jgi:hypothetical protein
MEASPHGQTAAQGMGPAMASWQTAESAGESFRGLLLCHRGRTGLIQRQLIGQVLVQVVAEIPPHAEPVGGHPHQLALGAQALEERHQP